MRPRTAPAEPGLRPPARAAPRRGLPPKAPRQPWDASRPWRAFPPPAHVPLRSALAAAPATDRAGATPAACRAARRPGRRTGASPDARLDVPLAREDHVHQGPVEEIRPAEKLRIDAALIVRASFLDLLVE